MTNTVAQGCPICNSSDSTREQFATAKIAEHVKEKARREESHRNWIDEHTANGTLSEIRAALEEHGKPR